MGNKNEPLVFVVFHIIILPTAAYAGGYFVFGSTEGGIGAMAVLGIIANGLLIYLWRH